MRARRKIRQPRCKVLAGWMEKILPEDSGSNPWRYCVVCRRHHDQGRKHIFTAKHKNKLNTIVNKFAEKVRCARQQVQSPGVVEGEVEPDSTLWCYCCQQEVSRHITDGLTTVVWGSLLEHMASPSHHKSTRRFWWLNGADKKQMQNFLLFEAEYRRYKELVGTALEDLATSRELKLSQEARLQQAREESQSILAREPPARLPPPTIRYVTVWNKHGVLQNPTGLHEGRRVWGGGIVKYKSGSDQLVPWPIDRLHRPSTTTGTSTSSSREEGVGEGRVTVSAAGSQLTAIVPPSLQEGEGNVHSGATPPWLVDDSGGGGGGRGGAPVVIGPSEEEFLRHKERQCMGKGRKGRVGADFHKKLASSSSSSQQDSEWFPSFGRVWNTGPRYHSLAEFQRERSSQQTLLTDHTLPSTQSVTDSHGPSTPSLTYNPGPSKQSLTYTPGPSITSDRPGPSLTYNPGPSKQSLTYTPGPSITSDRPGPSTPSLTYNPGPSTPSLTYRPGPSIPSLTYRTGPSKQSLTYRPGPSTPSLTYRPGPSTPSLTYRPGPSTTSDRPGPSGLTSQDLLTLPTAMSDPRRLTVGVAIKDVRPYVRKRKRKST